MATKSSLGGTWNLHEIRQYQSEESRAGGIHPDEERRGAPRGGEYEGCTLDIAADGTWSIVASGETRARGSWVQKKTKLELTEAPGAASDLERLLYARATKSSIAVAFGLVPDAHDGLDVFELDFRREPLPVPLTAKNGLRLIAQGGLTESQQYDLDYLEGEPLRELHAAGWDGWLAGTFASDASSPTFHAQRELLRRTVDERVPPGAFRHEHALHALRTLDEEGRWGFSDAVVSLMAALPPSADHDAEIAKALTPVWLEQLASYRSYCLLPETVWSCGRFPQPAFDELCRDMFLAPGFWFSNRALVGTDGLFRDPPLRARAIVHLANIIWADAGPVVEAHPAIVRQEAHAVLALTSDQRKKWRGGAETGWSNAQFFAVVYREDPASLPPFVVDAIAAQVPRTQGFDAAAQAHARASIAALPEGLRAKAAHALRL